MKHLLSVTIGPCKRGGGGGRGGGGQRGGLLQVYSRRRRQSVSHSISGPRGQRGAGEGGREREREPYVRSMRFVCWWFH